MDDSIDGLYSRLDMQARLLDLVDLFLLLFGGLLQLHVVLLDLERSLDMRLIIGIIFLHGIKLPLIIRLLLSQHFVLLPSAGRCSSAGGAFPRIYAWKVCAKSCAISCVPRGPAPKMSVQKLFHHLKR